MQDIADKISDNILECEGPLKTPCWVWQRSKTPYGYGQTWYDGKLRVVHRLVWQINVGNIPNGLFVLHKCDVGPCCNPDHLFLGTYQDNHDDMVAKGRSNFASIGENNHKAIINESEIPIIRKLCADGFMHTEIAELYGVQSSAIDKIAARRTWRHVP